MTSGKRPPNSLDTNRSAARRDYDVRLDVVGEGPEGPALDALIQDAGVEHAVRRHGWLSSAEFNRLYRQAHFMVLPTSSEGWPKVVSEAMAFRVVPVIGAVSCIPEFFGKTASGVCAPFDQPICFADAIDELVGNEAKGRVIADNAQAVAERFTYERHLENVRRMLNLASNRTERQRAEAA